VLSEVFNAMTILKRIVSRITVSLALLFDDEGRFALEFLCVEGNLLEVALSLLRTVHNNYRFLGCAPTQRKVKTKPFSVV
jgi:hypothetical protein